MRTHTAHRFAGAGDAPCAPVTLRPSTRVCACACACSPRGRPHPGAQDGYRDRAPVQDADATSVFQYFSGAVIMILALLFDAPCWVRASLSHRQ